MTIDAFLKIKGIRGECIDKQFLGKGVIQLISCTVNGDSAPDSAEETKPQDSDDEMIGLAGMWIGEDGFINEAPLEEVRSPPISGTPPPTEEKKDEPAELIWPFTFDISKKTDLSSAAIFSKFCQYKVLSKENANASGSFIPSAKLWVRKASGGTNLVYFVWEFRKLQVTAFSWMANSAGDVTESVSFRFGSCQLSYVPQAVTGGTAGQPLFSPWDLHSNTNTVEKLEDAEVLG